MFSFCLPVPLFYGTFHHSSLISASIWFSFTLNPPLFTSLGPNLVTFYSQSATFHQSWSKSGYVLLTISPILVQIWLRFTHNFTNLGPNLVTFYSQFRQSWPQSSPIFCQNLVIILPLPIPFILNDNIHLYRNLLHSEIMSKGPSYQSGCYCIILMFSTNSHLLLLNVW